MMSLLCCAIPHFIDVWTVQNERYYSIYLLLDYVLSKFPIVIV